MLANIYTHIILLQIVNDWCHINQAPIPPLTQKPPQETTHHKSHKSSKTLKKKQSKRYPVEFS